MLAQIRQCRGRMVGTPNALAPTTLYAASLPPISLKIMNMFYISTRVRRVPTYPRLPREVMRPPTLCCVLNVGVP